MEHSRYRYLYGPVSSWRLGRSLGIDPLSCPQKTCNFDCVYCQAGRTEVFPSERKVFVPTEALIEEILLLPELSLDYITFAGNGEPTLASNLGDMIREVRKLRPEKIAVITNASLLGREDVRRDLLLADLVEAKLDAAAQGPFENVARPMPGLSVESIMKSLEMFRSVYGGRLALQVMFVMSNRAQATAIATWACDVKPDEIEVNTPLRDSAVRPLPPGTIADITETFRRICGSRVKVRSVYEVRREASRPFDPGATERRRGKENTG